MFQETDRILSEKFKETDKQFKETDRKIRELDRLFTSQWGKLVESLVEGDLIKLLKEREILVESIIPRRRGNKAWLQRPDGTKPGFLCYQSHRK
jgi:hypothetical protein